jgi:hypothetical protein
MLTSKKIPLFVWASVLAVLILAAYSIRKRTEVEASNRSVSIAAEFETIEALAAGEGMPIQDAISDCKANGLRALVINEETVADLISAGRVSLIAVEPTPEAPRGLQLQFQDLSMLPRVKLGLIIRFAQEVGPLTVSGNLLQLPPVSAGQIRATPLGLNPYQVAAAKLAQLEIVGRYANTPGMSADSISKTLQWAKRQGVKVYLPLGDEVLGFRAVTDQTLDELRANKILYASIEFGKIAGDVRMVEKGKDIVVRLHSAQTAELDKLTPFDAQDRYVKAARERNMRILLVRPLSLSARAPVNEYCEFIGGITRQIIKFGEYPGRPSPYVEPRLPKVFFPILALALAPVIWFVITSFTSRPRVKVAVAVFLAALIASSVTKVGQEGFALLASISFPILGFFALDSLLPRLRGPEILRVLIGFWVVAVISLLGGVSVAGMLNGLSFYIHASEFQAVKVSVFLPIIVVGLHYFVKLTDWKSAMKSPMTWGTTALGLALGLALAIMIARTGNDTGVGPSDGELVFRSLLDRFLYVRPRTKEFLIGHPVLVIGIGMLGRLFSHRNRATHASDDGVEIRKSTFDAMAGWTVLALMVGAIGQTSVVNTLCHIHIPFFLSLIRDAEGMGLGCIIGLALWTVIKRWLPSGE